VPQVLLLDVIIGLQFINLTRPIMVQAVWTMWNCGPSRKVKGRSIYNNVRPNMAIGGISSAMKLKMAT